MNVVYTDTIVIDRYGREGKILSIDKKNGVAWVKTNRGYSLEKIGNLSVRRGR